MSLYGDFTIEESCAIGARFKVICVCTWNYEDTLTHGKEYHIQIIERILPMSPLCSFINDKGNVSAAHLARFEKVK
jgi:hypothetical protein